MAALGTAKIEKLSSLQNDNFGAWKVSYLFIQSVFVRGSTARTYNIPPPANLDCWLDCWLAKIWAVFIERRLILKQ